MEDMTCIPLCYAEYSCHTFYCDMHDMARISLVCMFRDYLNKMSYKHSTNVAPNDLIIEIPPFFSQI